MNCKICGTEIPIARLKALPGTNTCVKHSLAEKKIGTPISLGQGDHTYVELNIMEAEEFRRIEKLRTTRSSDSGFGL
jgi:hypothetical protein